MKAPGSFRFHFRRQTTGYPKTIHSRAGRDQERSSADPIYRRRAAMGVQVPAARDAGRSEYPPRIAAAFFAKQVLSPGNRQGRDAFRRVPEDKGRTIRIQRVDFRQHRIDLLYAGTAEERRRLRQQSRRRFPDDGRPQFIFRRPIRKQPICRHSARFRWLRWIACRSSAG